MAFTNLEGSSFISLVVYCSIRVTLLPYSRILSSRVLVLYLLSHTIL